MQCQYGKSSAAHEVLEKAGKHGGLTRQGEH
jgi:hypothetical protein